MKSKSAIEKGKRFENYIAQEIENSDLGRAIRTPGSGSGLNKGDIFANIPFLLECKNHKKYSLNPWIDQVRREADQGNWSPDKWALIIRDYRTAEKKPDVYALIDFWEFLKLLKKESKPLIKKPDQKLRYDLQYLKKVCQKVIKQI